MKYKRPYIIETKNYIQVCYGGGISNKLKNVKRNKIKKYTRASQKRLCEKIDCAIRYKPTMILNVYFDKSIPVKETNLILIKYFETMYQYYETVIKHVPLIFWRKNFDSSGNFWISLMLDFPRTFNMKKFIFASNLFWKGRVGKEGRIELELVAAELPKEMVKKFCFDNSTTAEENVGRWWGTIYGKYHKFKKPKKTYYSVREIKEIIKDLKKLETDQIKAYMYEKPGEKTKDFSIF